MVETTYLTLEEFLSLPEDDVACELVDGQAIPKMSPKSFHAAIQSALIILFQSWSQGKGRNYPEWSILLTRHGKDWVPVPDLTYISFERLPSDWMKNEACPTAPELAIEIISPGEVASFEVSSKACDDRKTFGSLAEKASDYLAAGIPRVWVIDPQARTITVFYPDAPPQTKRGTASLTDTLLEGLTLTPQQVWQQAGLPN